jgi:hypothetical protein
MAGMILAVAIFATPSTPHLIFDTALILVSDGRLP